MACKSAPPRLARPGLLRIQRDFPVQYGLDGNKKKRHPDAERMYENLMTGGKDYFISSNRHDWCSPGFW